MDAFTLTNKNEFQSKCRCELLVVRSDYKLIRVLNKS